MRSNLVECHRIGIQRKVPWLSLSNSAPEVQLPKNVNIYDSLLIVTSFYKVGNISPQYHEKTKIEHIYQLLL